MADGFVFKFIQNKIFFFVEKNVTVMGMSIYKSLEQRFVINIAKGDICGWCPPQSKRFVDIIWLLSILCAAFNSAM